LKSTPLGIGDRDDVTFHEAEEPGLGRKKKRRRCHVLRKVEVSVTSSDQSLTLETRESYSLSIGSNGAAILVQVGVFLCV
jgi:hypothetical protein